MQAQIVCAPLQQRGFNQTAVNHSGPFQNLNQRGNVLADQLFLEIDGVGGNYDPLTPGCGKESRREQVGHRFPHAGAALNYQVSVLVDSFGHRRQHFGLFCALFKSLKSLGKRAVGAHQPGNLGFVEVGKAAVVAAPFRAAQPGGQAAHVKTGQPKDGAAAVSFALRDGPGFQPGFQPGQQIGNTPIAAGGQGSGIGQQARFQLRRLSQQVQEKLARGLGIVQCLVGIRVGYSEVFGQVGKVVFVGSGQQKRRQVPGVVAGVNQFQPVSIQEAQVKGNIVPDDGQAF